MNPTSAEAGPPLRCVRGRQNGFSRRRWLERRAAAPSCCRLLLPQLRIASRRPPRGGSQRRRMELRKCVSVPCHPKNTTAQPNSSSKSTSDLLVTFLGCILATMCMVGVVGNIYALVVSMGSMYVYISLALADLLCLSTSPIMVCMYLVRNWSSETFCRMGSVGTLGKGLISEGLAETIWKSDFQRTCSRSREPRFPPGSSFSN